MKPQARHHAAVLKRYTLPVSRWMEERAGWTIKKFVRTIRR